MVHIAAHIHDEPGTAEIVRTVIRSGFSEGRTGKMLDRNQRARHAWRSPTNLVAWLASPITPVTPTQLSELMIHQQDIRRALDRPRAIPPDRLGEVLDFTTSRAGMAKVSFARWRIRGLRLVATDMTWTLGAGAEVAGPGEAILMAINGRDDALADLTGPGAQTLTYRTAKRSSKFSSV